MSDPKLERAKADYANVLANGLRSAFGSNSLRIDTVTSQDGRGETSTALRVMDGDKRMASIVSQYVERDGIATPHAVIKMGTGDNMVQVAYKMDPTTGKLDTSSHILIGRDGNRLSEADSLKVGALQVDQAKKIAEATNAATVPNPHYVAPAAGRTTAIPPTLSVGHFLSKFDSTTGRQKTAMGPAAPGASV